MSRVKIDETFRLIHSLSGHEQAYFTDRAEKEADYYRLYCKLKEMQKFDVKSIKEQFQNLSALANYLYEAILKSMRNYRSSTKSSQIKESLIDNQFLWEKGHYSQCQHKLSKARQDAEGLGIYSCYSKSIGRKD